MGRVASSVEEGASRFDVHVGTVCVSSDGKETSKAHRNASYENNLQGLRAEFVPREAACGAKQPLVCVFVRWVESFFKRIQNVAQFSTGKVASKCETCSPNEHKNAR